jgi:hypothetical protein
MNPTKQYIFFFSAFLFLITSFGTSAAAGEESESDSILILPIQANLKILENRLNNEMPELLADINEPNTVCIEAQWLKTKGIPKCRLDGLRVYCEDRWIKTKTTPEIRCDVKGWVKRNGNISVSGNGSTLKFAFPFKAQVSAKAIVQETADAAATIYVSATPRINNDWSIAVDVVQDFTWSERPNLELFGLIKVSIGSKVEPELRDRINKFAEKIPGILAELKLGEKVAATWSDVQNPIKINDAPEVYVLFNPKGVAYSGFNVENNILKTTLSIKGSTQVTLGKPTDSIQKTELSSLGKIPYQDGLFHFMLPTFVPYSELLAIANINFPNGYVTEIENGSIKGTLKISDPEIIKSNDGKLLISVSVSYDNRSNWLKAIDIFNWLDFNGVLTFKGIPYIDTSARTLAIDNLEYDSSTSSKLFDALVGVAGIKVVRNHLARQIVFAYGPKLDDGVANANKALNITTKDGVKVSASLQNAAIEKLSVNDSNLRIETKLSGTVSASIGL